LSTVAGADFVALPLA